MVKTIPLALITISSLNTILTMGIFCDILQLMLIDTLKGWRIMIIVKVTTNQDPCLWLDGTNRINRL